MVSKKTTEETVKETISTVKETINTVEETIAVVEETMGVKPQEPNVSVYSADELARNYKVFNTSREIVVVALRLAGKKTATFDEAKTIIENFKNKEVK